MHVHVKCMSNACRARKWPTHRGLGLSFSLSPLVRFLSLSPLSHFLSLSLPLCAFSQSLLSHALFLLSHAFNLSYRKLSSSSPLLSHAFFLLPSPCSFLSLYLSFSFSSHSIPSLSVSSCLSLSLLMPLSLVLFSTITRERHSQRLLPDSSSLFLYDCSFSLG